MESRRAIVPRRMLVTASIAALAGALGLVVAGLTGPGPGPAVAEGPMAHHAHHRGGLSAPELRFHDQMRKLWEDHITWTRLAIVSFTADNPDLQPTLDRLLRNQQEIGDAIRPFYGRAAGNALTKLLQDHINGAVDVLVAARSGDQQAFADAKGAWYSNGRSRTSSTTPTPTTGAGERCAR
jgi:hypothetical protein